MHEIHLAKNIVKALFEEMKKRRLKRLKSLKVRLGELNAIEPESVKQAFDECLKETNLKGASIEVEVLPLSKVCLSCKRALPFEDMVKTCPSCKGSRFKNTTGYEIEIISMEAV